MELLDTSIDALKYANIPTVGKLEITHKYTFYKMADDNTIDFIMADSYQIYLFYKWFNSLSLINNITEMAELISCFTDN